jgi:hypothetical protein
MIWPWRAVPSGSTTSRSVYGLMGRTIDLPVGSGFAFAFTTVWSLTWRGFDWRTTYWATFFSSSRTRPVSMPSNDTGAGGSLYRRRARLRGMAADARMPMGAVTMGQYQCRCSRCSKVRRGPTFAELSWSRRSPARSSMRSSLQLDHEV